MNDTYAALGEVLAAAYANGDSLEGGIDPGESSDGRRGLRIERNGYTLNVLANPTEPRFRIDLPFVFASQLRESYTPADVADHTGVPFDDLSDSERAEAIRAVLIEDLERLDDRYDRFSERVTDLEPVESELLTLTYGDTDLWNGVVLATHFNPYREFSQYRYDDLAGTVVADADRLRPVIAAVYDEVVDDGDEGLKTGTASRGGYRGFQ